MEIRNRIIFSFSELNLISVYISSTFIQLKKFDNEDFNASFILNVLY